MKVSPILFSLFGTTNMVQSIHKEMGYDIGAISLHSFPDGETSVKIDTSVQDKTVLFIADLAHPDSKVLPLLFAAETARALGAKKIGLIAPYLPYMRQDIQFHPGESITSKYFSKLISTYFDGLLTIDPHLHRWHSLSDIYSIPAKALHATDCIARWIKIKRPDAILIGPDAESLQWVSEIAQKTDRPFTILEKIRHDDHRVEVSIPNVDQYKQYTPVLVDDIISTAATMIETVQHLKSLNMKPPICIGVHALFSEQAYEDLRHAGAEQIVTCNTIEHPSNQIDVADMLAHTMNILF